MAPPPNQVRLAQLYGRKYGVDPKLLLAIGGHETHWGSLGAGRQGYTLGYGATDSGTISRYAGVKNQYRYAASTLASWGVHGIQDLIAGRAARYATDPHWEAGVASVYRSLGGQQFGGAAAAHSSPPAVAPNPITHVAQQVAQWQPSPQALALISRSLTSGQKANQYAPTVLPKFVPMQPIQPAAVKVSSKPTTSAPVDVPGPAGTPTKGWSYPQMQTGGKSPYTHLSFAGHTDWQHVDVSLLNRLNTLAAKKGVTISVISGYRSPGYSARVGGYGNDPHARGEAVDAYVNGVAIGNLRGWFQLLKAAGLESGAQPGFYRGKTDPMHIQIPGSGVNKSLHARSTYAR